MENTLPRKTQSKMEMKKQQKRPNHLKMKRNKYKHNRKIELKISYLQLLSLLFVLSLSPTANLYPLSKLVTDLSEE